MPDRNKNQSSRGSRDSSRRQDDDRRRGSRQQEQSSGGSHQQGEMDRDEDGRFSNR